MKNLEAYQQMYRDGRMNRREFMAALGALGISATVAGGFLQPEKAQATTPRKGGTLKVAFEGHGPDDQMDPILGTHTIDYSRARATYNNLTQLGEGLSVHPELAEEWSSNTDATAFTFKIRKGVRFHDGSPLTADDVVWSLNRHLGKSSLSKAKSLFQAVSEWKKIDTHTVKAVLKNPNSDLPILLGIYQAKIVKKGTTNFNKGIGTGPYKLQSFQPGVRSVHVRNVDYWRDGPNLDIIEMTGITDPIARVNALISGDVHLISSVDSKSIRLIQQNRGVHISSIPSAQYLGICCLKNSAPGQDDNFVKGLQYIQDRERIVRSILKGHGSVGNDQPISPAYGKDHCAKIPQRQYDPDKAKWHFKKSGYSSAELYVAPVISGIEEMCLMTQANLRKIDFNLKIRKVPMDGYYSSVWMKEPLNVTTWNMRPTAHSMLTIQFSPESSWNDTYWKNERFGKLLKLSLAETDPAKRHEMFCEMETLIHEEGGMVIPAHVNILDGVKDTVHGIPQVPLGFLGGSEWPEFVWMEA